LADKLIFFRPSGRYARLAAEDVVDYLARFDFSIEGCALEQLFIGDVGPAVEGGDAYSVQDRIFGRQSWPADGPTTWLFCVDWHGTPTFFYDRGCPQNPQHIDMDFIDANPILNVVRGADDPMIAAALPKAPASPVSAVDAAVAGEDEECLSVDDSGAPARAEDATPEAARADGVLARLRRWLS
jgi:hypothetical protein